ncbi:ankyrin repeat-containing domain protein [Chytridium lagenaria]|nr:ankyrin repeat-containing domain protein [Chytridium lagenaria]
MPLAYIVLDKGLKLIEAVHDILKSGKYSLALSIIHKVPMEAVRDSVDPKGRTLWHVVGDHAGGETWNEEYASEVTKALLQAKTPLDSPDVELGRYPLHNAARNGQVHVVKTLLENGAKVDVLDKEGGSPLLYGVLSRSFEVVELILNANPDPNLSSGSPLSSPVAAAVETGNLQILTILLNASYNPNIDGSFPRETALMLAVQANNYQMVTALLNAKADVNQKSYLKVMDGTVEKETMVEVVFVAIKKGACEVGGKSVFVYEALLTSGADVNVKHPISGRTPLMIALHFTQRRAEVVTALLQAGANVDIIDPKTEHSPFQTVLFNRTDEFKKLLEVFFDANPNLSLPCTKTSLTPLDWALQNGETILFTKLLKLGADANIKSLFSCNPLQRTTLMLAIKLNDLKAVEALLETELDLEAEDTDGRTCVHYVVDPEVVASYENVAMLEMIAAKGLCWRLRIMLVCRLWGMLGDIE